MGTLKDEENYINLIKVSNNVEDKKNEEIEKIEVCMEKYINLNIFEYFKNLKELYLVKNNITDITPLFNCINLTILFLQINKIKSILGIEKLRYLEKLNLFNNELNEQFINIEHNKYLVHIDLSDNQIESIDFFYNTNIFLYINLANNSIRNIEPLKNNFHLEYLNISGNKIEKFEDIQVLHKLKKIKELYLNSIYYKNNILTDNLLYKHYFLNNFPNLQVLDHEIITDKERKHTMSDIETLKCIIDFKINFIREKYKKEKYYILFINNKNISYLNDVLKPYHFYSNFVHEYKFVENKEKENISNIKEQIKFYLSAYTARFNYIIKRLKEERNLQIRYLTTSINSYFNIFFKSITKEQDEYKFIENFIKLNFNVESLKNYYIDDIKIENIIKVKKLNHNVLDTLIEEQTNSLIYKKNILFLHPYNYCKLNDNFDFDEKEYTVDECEKKKFFEKNYICSCYNINHILKTLIKLFLEKDQLHELVHLIYYKNKLNDNILNYKNDINIKKKILRNKKFDFPFFSIYIVENYFFEKEYKEVTAYSTQENKNDDNDNENTNGDNKNKNDDNENKNDDNENKNDDNKNKNDENKSLNNEIKFKIYYTLPKHTNLKYIVNISLLNKNKEKNIEKNNEKNIEKNNEKNNERNELNIVHSSIIKTAAAKKIKRDDFLKYIGIKNKTNNIFCNENLIDDFFHYILNFEHINFFHITKYFIKLSKIICEIKKNIYLLIVKNNLNCSEKDTPLIENGEIRVYEDMEILKKEKEKIINNLKNKNIDISYYNDHSNDKKNEETIIYMNNLYISKIYVHVLKNHYNNLKELHLRNNNINNLKTFFHFDSNDIESLEVLDLSFNCISDLTPLYKYFPNIIHINLSFNYIYDYHQIQLFSVHHQHIEYLSILNNSLYIKKIYYENIHLLFPQIKIFNDITIMNKTNFDIKNYSFICENKERVYDEYGMDDDDEDGHNKNYIKMKNIKDEKYLKVYKDININNYEMHIQMINLSNLYMKLTYLNFEIFKYLKILDLSNNGIEDLTNLKLPKELKVLNLRNNKIFCIDFLHDKLEIEMLLLDNNELKNINKVNLLKNLKILRCSHNKLSTIPLFQKCSLKEIDIHNNFIKDITHIVLIKNKQSLICINIYNNKINFLNLDLYLIHIFPNLLILNNSSVERRQNSEKYFKNIYTLDVFFDIYNMYPPYTSLQSLEINNLKIKNILFDINNDNFYNLKFLNISNNYINNIHNIGPLDNLKTLILNNNKHINENSFMGEHDRNVLNSFKSLEDLDISFCLLSKTNFLKKCPNLKNLKTLNLEGNNINSIKYLENLQHLKVLNLSNNKISKISPDSFPKSLENLNISNNLIRNLSPFDNLKNVETLDLRVNRIDNIDEFKYLKNLEKLKTLYLNGNRKIKEHFIIIKNMLTQIENFDNKIMKEQNNLTSNLEEKREEFKLHKDISKKNILITNNNDNNNNYNVTYNYSNIKSPAKNKTKMTKLKGHIKKEPYEDRLKKDSFTIIGKKVNSSGNY
ncbi:leucine-rich repeat protein [Plasmodium gaboni]|uniref:Leucine-rich repeat protein n=1 Tax=Plasmodium gaboni TaxID=647221 RepID=A0ABY1UTT4_9APIC|nr:leucine-rich repeat protein [Plasmodium gaboni]